jgi:hypothetical protein
MHIEIICAVHGLLLKNVSNHLITKKIAPHNQLGGDTVPAIA